MEMKVTDIEMIRILRSVHREFVTTKMYFSENKNAKELEGMVSPTEYKELYNNLLEQAHAQGELEFITKKIE